MHYLRGVSASSTSGGVYIRLLCHICACTSQCSASPARHHLLPLPPPLLAPPPLPPPRAPLLPPNHSQTRVSHIPKNSQTTVTYAVCKIYKAHKTCHLPHVGQYIRDPVGRSRHHLSRCAHLADTSNRQRSPHPDPNISPIQAQGS